MRLGADVDQVDSLVAVLERSARQLSAIDLELAASCRSVRWQGPDAERFRSTWSRSFAPGLRHAATSMGDAAIQARRQVAEQRRASAADASGLIGAEHPLLAGPAHIRLVTVQATASAAGLAAGAELQFRVEDLGGGQLRVVRAAEVSGGVAAEGGSGVSVSWGGSTYAGGALTGAALRASVASGSSWIIAESELDTFVGHEAMALALGAVSPVSLAGAGDGTLDAVGGAIDAGIGFLGLGRVAHLVGADGFIDMATYDPPPAETVFAEAGASADIALALALVSAAAAASGAASITDTLGVSHRPGTGETTVYLRTEGDAAVDLLNALGVDNATTSGRAQIGLVLDRAGDPVAVQIAMTTADHDQLTVGDVRIDMTRPEMADAGRAVLDSLKSGGDPVAAMRQALAVSALSASSGETRYALGETSTYGIETPVGSVSVMSQELRRID